MTTSIPRSVAIVLLLSLLSVQLVAGFDLNQFSSKRLLADKDSKDDGTDSPSSSNVETNSSFIDSELIDIVWCGDDTKNIFVLSSKGTVYQTLDQGRTWNKLRETFQRTGKREAENDEHVGDVTSIIQSPVNSQMLVFLGSHGIYWLTEDCGANIKAVNSGRNIKEFQLHPSEAKWVLASAYTTCDDFDDGEPCQIYQELYMSKDLGETWTFVIDYIIQFAWACQDGILVINIPQDRIVVAHLLDKKGHQKAHGWSERAELAYSDDFFKTQTTVVERGNKFLITRDFFFAVQANDEDTQNVKLLVGDPFKKEYDLQPVVLPTKKSKKSKKKDNQLHEHSYTILDTSEGQVFLHINHEGGKSKHGNVYISDSTGRRFSLSIHNQVRNPDGQCDFEKVAGLEGIFLTNVYDGALINKFKDDFSGDEQISTSGSSSSKPTGKSKPFSSSSSLSKEKDKRFKELDEFKITMVSFDKGGIWEPLKAPKRTSKGEDIECEKESDCRLHLHSVSNGQFGPFYSTDNSLGIVIGVGNVGRYLSNKDDEVNTYLSRNGGLDWYEIMQGSHIYEIGDHGAIIVAAPDQEATKVLYYTWNEGLTWDTVQISKTPIQVANIIIEPTNTAEHFIVYGRQASSSKEGKEPKGVIVSVDFASLHERTCKNPDKPDTEDSDYEKWTPNGAISKKCLMGHQATYVRRKREAQCFNTEQWDRWDSWQNCECTEEDWECDLGYERKGEGPCQNTTSEVASLDPPEECDGEYYYVTQGYRKVAGNTCEGGVSHDPLRFPCPGKGLTKSRVLMLLLLGGVITGLFIYTNKSYSKRAQKFAQNFGERARATTNQSFSRLGFKKMGENQEPDSLHEDDDEFDNRLKFDDHDEPARHIDNKNLLDMVQGRKKMAERGGLESAQKSIPAISRPGAGNDQSNELMDM